jgi:hypothetical protein
MYENVQNEIIIKEKLEFIYFRQQIFQIQIKYILNISKNKHINIFYIEYYDYNIRKMYSLENLP